MKILVGSTWKEGFPDYHKAPEENRIRVIGLKNLEKLEGMFFVRPKSARMVCNYLLEIGFRQLFRKIRSRLGETARNEKFVSCGVGIILEGGASGRFQKGFHVAFLAPCHPACVERLVLPDDLIELWPQPPSPPLFPGQIRYKPVAGDGAQAKPFWNELRGAGTHSGVQLQPSVTRDIRHHVIRLLSEETWETARLLDSESNPDPNVQEVRPAASPPEMDGRPTGIVFGYGNYAKTFLIPNVSGAIRVEAVHEIDPTQMALGNDSLRWDSSPTPRGVEKTDVFFIAGYHHTHVPLAIAAVKQGAFAVVEKPVAVDETQLGELLSALKSSGPRLFSCFHKRYMSFNEMAWEDLEAAPGVPVSYSCIVYEVPLPPFHWYRWPNSHSRLVSNGCHWIDHFLYLNRYPEVDGHDLAVAPDGTVNASVRLANGAFFTMVLTDQGSERIGLRDHIELRTPHATVRMTDGGTYQAEGKSRIIRKAAINKLSSYGNMYSSIAAKIAAGESGDPVESVRISAGLVLALEKSYQRIVSGA